VGLEGRGLGPEEEEEEEKKENKEEEKPLLPYSYSMILQRALDLEVWVMVP
jgi:hypothetical protein